MGFGSFILASQEPCCRAVQVWVSPTSFYVWLHKEMPITQCEEGLRLSKSLKRLRMEKGFLTAFDIFEFYKVFGFWKASKKAIVTGFWQGCFKEFMGYRAKGLCGPPDPPTPLSKTTGKFVKKVYIKKKKHFFVWLKKVKYFDVFTDIVLVFKPIRKDLLSYLKDFPER